MSREKIRESVRDAIDNLLFEACGCGGMPSEIDMEEVPLDAIPWVLNSDDPVVVGEPDPYAMSIDKSEVLDLVLQMSKMVSCPKTAKVLEDAAHQIMSMGNPESKIYDPGMLSGGEEFMDDHMGDIRDEDILDDMISHKGSCG